MASTVNNTQETVFWYLKMTRCLFLISILAWCFLTDVMLKKKDFQFTQNFWRRCLSDVRNHLQTKKINFYKISNWCLQYMYASQFIFFYLFNWYFFNHNNNIKLVWLQGSARPYYGANNLLWELKVVKICFTCFPSSLRAVLVNESTYKYAHSGIYVWCLLKTNWDSNNCFLSSDSHLDNSQLWTVISWQLCARDLHYDGPLHFCSGQYVFISWRLMLFTHQDKWAHQDNQLPVECLSPCQHG